jgi:hypothetical protein
MAVAELNGQSQTVSVIRHCTYLVFLTVSWPGHRIPVEAATTEEAQPNRVAPLPGEWCPPEDKHVWYAVAITLAGN